MCHLCNAAMALMAIGETANAQVPYDYGPADYGSYYAYGANRANPSIAPNGWDQGNPRDFQLQGSR